MKTAIYLSDALFADAEALAREMGVSRSELCARAVEEYLAKHRNQDVTAHLNQVYAAEDGGLDPALRRAQVRSLGREAW